ncbi:hypothetical protein, partial [Phytopseudomonas daroniae]|uniref:hypothetical protein n=1 Tax=Phytopseudomonas daroniae TaxID=2487519 RepID=UPI001ABF4467
IFFGSQANQRLTQRTATTQQQQAHAHNETRGSTIRFELAPRDGAPAAIFSADPGRLSPVACILLFLPRGVTNHA